MLKRTQINVTEAQLKKLKEESVDTGISIAGIIRLAVNNYFSNKEGN